MTLIVPTFGCEKASNDLKDFSIVAGGIWGRVNDVEGVSLKDVAVFIVSQDEQTGSIYTDETGVFIVSSIAESERSVLRFEKDGYVTQFATVPVYANVVSDVNVTMIKQGHSALFLAEEQLQVEFENVELVLPPDSLVDEQGDYVSGYVKVTITYYDIATDDILAAPGDFVCVYGENDVDALIGSVGMFAVEFSQEDQKLDIAQNYAAEVSIKIAENSGFGFAHWIPGWRFGDQSGKWIQRDSCLVDIYEEHCSMNIDSAGIWNLELPYSSVCYSGKVLGGNDQVVGGVEIVAEGLDYVGRSMAHTNKEGEYEISIQADSNANLIFKKEFNHFQIPIQTPIFTEATGLCEVLDDLSIPSFAEQDENDGYDFFGDGSDDSDDENETGKSACCGL